MRDCFFIQMIRFSKGKSTSPAIILLGLFSISNNSTFNFPPCLPLAPPLPLPLPLASLRGYTIHSQHVEMLPQEENNKVRSNSDGIVQISWNGRGHYVAWS